MGDPYVAPSVPATYNQTPPADDGTKTEANRIKWSTIKTKLSDPNQSYASLISSETNSAIGKLPGGAGVVSTAIGRTMVSSDQGKLVIDTAGGNAHTLPVAATESAPFVLSFANLGTTASTIAGSGAETIDGLAGIAIGPNGGVWLHTDGTNWFTGGQNSGFSTGDVKATFKTAEGGWVPMDDGTIGSAASSASTRANADTLALYTVLWDNVIDTWAPVSTGRGASAAADFAADKTLTLPKILGRALAASGTGAGLTARALGETLGEEEHTQTEAELDPHDHDNRGGNASAGTSTFTLESLNTGTINATFETGGGDPFNVMQPTLFMNYLIKL